MQTSGKSLFPKMRKRIYRSFSDWHSKHGEQFLVPLHYLKRTDRCLEISFRGLNPALSIFLTWEIGVCVDWEGECLDCLVYFEAYPKHDANGYHCGLCIDEYAQITYSSREELWQEHLFQPFLEWFNEKLVPARYLGLYNMEGKGCTWVKLLSEPDPEAFQLLPVWCLDEENVNGSESL